MRRRPLLTVVIAALAVGGLIAVPPAPQATASTEPRLLDVWGGPGPGSGPDQFDRPHGIAVAPDGLVYVADTNNHRIVRYDPGGTPVKRWGHEGSGNEQFQHPWGVDASQYGINVADTSNHRITFITLGDLFFVEGGFFFPTDVAFWQPTVFPATPLAFVVEGQDHKVTVVEFDGTPTGQGWGENGGGYGEFNFPHGIAVGPGGTVYVADTFNHRIQRFDTAGTFLGAWGQEGTGEGEFAEPHGVTVDIHGHVYVADKNNHRIQVFTADGQFLTSWGSQGSGPGQFDEPRDVAVAPHGVVYVADTGNNRIQKFAFDPVIGLVDPTQGLWHLRDPLGQVRSFYYGNPGDVPFVGDWNCDGVQTPGLYRQSDGFVYLRNSNTQGVADITFFFGNPGDVPIAGDFNGSGCDTVSIYRPSNQTFYIINQLGQDGAGLGAAEFSYVFGNPGDKPFTGDFNGNGITTVGLHRESTGLVYFRNSHTQGVADNEFFFGDPGDRFVTGDWNADLRDSPAVFRSSNTTFYFRFTNTQGNADHEFVFGQPGWLPVAGRLGGG
jgi:sugar lactone lactonase YvrE